LRTAARITAFSPGQSPPPVSMPIFIAYFLRRCNMDFPEARGTPEDTTGTFTMARKD
jgi:hypothetical protein